MAKTSGDRLAYGATILTYGLIFLLDRTGILSKIPYGQTLMGIGSFFLIAGVIFLFAKAEKSLGITLSIIGIIINADFFFGWMRSYSSFIVPITLIVVGGIMVLTSRK